MNPTQVAERTFKVTRLWHQLLKNSGASMQHLNPILNALSIEGFIKLIVQPQGLRYVETHKMQSQFYKKELRMLIDSIVKGTHYNRDLMSSGKTTKHYIDLDGADLGRIDVCIETDSDGRIVGLYPLHNNLAYALSDDTKQDLENELEENRELEHIEHMIDMAKEERD